MIDRLDQLLRIRRAGLRMVEGDYDGITRTAQAIRDETLADADKRLAEIREQLKRAAEPADGAP